MQFFILVFLCNNILVQLLQEGDMIFIHHTPVETNPVPPSVPELGSKFYFVASLGVFVANVFSKDIVCVVIQRVIFYLINFLRSRIMDIPTLGVQILYINGIEYWREMCYIKQVWHTGRVCLPHFSEYLFNLFFALVSLIAFY